MVALRGDLRPLKKVAEELSQLGGVLGGFFRQYRIILSADTASEVRQLLSQKRR